MAMTSPGAPVQPAARRSSPGPGAAALVMAVLLAGLWLLEFVDQASGNRLDAYGIEARDATSVLVTYAYETGFPIDGLDALDPDVHAFHAGTATRDGALVTAGGRVLTVAATGRTLAEARARVYDNVPRIRFEGMYYRSDIAMMNAE